MILQNFANVRRWIIWHIYHRIYARGGFWTPLHVNEASFIVFYRNNSSTSLIHSGVFDFLSNQEMNINEHFHVKIQRISSRRAFCLSRLNCQMNSTDSRFWPTKYAWIFKNYSVIHFKEKFWSKFIINYNILANEFISSWNMINFKWVFKTKWILGFEANTEVSFLRNSSRKLPEANAVLLPSYHHPSVWYISRQNTHVNTNL